MTRAEWPGSWLLRASEVSLGASASALLPKNEDDALCQRINPVLVPAFVAVTAPKGRASVISVVYLAQDSGLRNGATGTVGSRRGKVVD